jgi:uncharacterized protein (TIGR02391 family)
VDEDWAVTQLEAFIGAIDVLDELARVGPLVADSESQSFKLGSDVAQAENAARTLEPIAQLIMEAVEPGLSAYEKADRSDPWGTRWDPPKHAALRALGLARSGAEAKEKLRPDAPGLAADQFHPWVWEAARPMWEAGSQPTAVLHAAQAVNARLQQKLGRFDVSDADLCTEAFSTDPPREGRPRLRFGGDRTSETWRSLQIGAASFGRGCFQAIRNPVAHSHQHALSEREALEALAALSLLARWIEECQVEAIPPTE